MPQTEELLMFRSLLVILLILVLGQSSQTLAGVVPALNANFDSDALGTPIYDLPGEPVGDIIQNPGTNTLSVVSSAGGLTNQPLKIRRSGSGGLTRFKLAPGLNACESYVLSWKVMFEEHQQSTTFTIRDTSWDVMAILGFSPAGLWLGYPSSPIYPDIDDGGTGGIGLIFDFEMTMDTVADTYSLSLNGTPIAEMQDFKLWGADLDRLEVAFGGSAGDYVFVDDILVMADCSFVANEETSWGNVKAYYR
ncbi:MAG: hypothetical protein ACI9UK_000563 [Candidatus Krumholzibacteriia bacterium]|jgi:hypothetical protein